MTITKFEQDLIDSIRAEDRCFNLARWADGDQTIPPTCGTASCIAGHCIAIRPELAEGLLAAHPRYRWSSGRINHARLAAEIYRREVGRECRLDFYGDVVDSADPPFAELEDCTRKDAILHVLDQHPQWPWAGTLRRLIRP